MYLQCVKGGSSLGTRVLIPAPPAASPSFPVPVKNSGGLEGPSENSTLCHYHRLSLMEEDEEEELGVMDGSCEEWQGGDKVWTQQSPFPELEAETPVVSQ